MDSDRRNVFQNLEAKPKDSEMGNFNTPFVQGKSSQGMYSVDFTEIDLELLLVEIIRRRKKIRII